MNYLLSCVLICQTISAVPAPAATDPLAAYVGELRKCNDPAFRTPTQNDLSLENSILQSAVARGDDRASVAESALPPYLAYQKSLNGRLALTDAEAIELYQLAIPILRARMPVSYAPLSEIEALTVNLYTGTTFDPLSADLASHGGKARNFPTFAATLDAALSHLPTYDGIVFHVQDTTEQDRASLRIGKEVPIPYYLSTSSEKIGWQGNTRMIIHSKSGRDISNFSVNPQEHEVLLPRNSRLRVTALPVLIDGVYTIEYDEI